MNDTFNADSLDNTAADTTGDTAAAPVAAKPAPTKEEKIASLKAQIAKLEVRLYNVENDIVAPVKAPKVVVLPEVGSYIEFMYGRTTATTEPVQRTGLVVAVKAATEVDGKTKPALVKVQIGEGFDAELVTIYLGQIVAAAE